MPHAPPHYAIPYDYIPDSCMRSDDHSRPEEKQTRHHRQQSATAPSTATKSVLGESRTRDLRISQRIAAIRRLIPAKQDRWYETYALTN